MSHSFVPQQGPIIVTAEVDGLAGIGVLRLALDTGATRTLIDRTMLSTVGYDPGLAPGRVQITTANGTAVVPEIPVAKLRALGQERAGFRVLCHTLPPGIGIDGLLGLDFLRGQVLMIDFRAGSITLT